MYRSSRYQFALVFMIYAAFVTAWTLFGIQYLDLLEDLSKNGFIIPTMLLGSIIAGSTAEGGGAVAFPALTLLFKITPQTARDFTLMIQSVGMTAASIGLILMRKRIAWSVVGWAAGLCLPGIILGAEFFSKVLAPAGVKIFFVSWWLGFAFALHLIYRRQRFATKDSLRFCSWGDFGLMTFAALIGGIITGMSGSGLDITVFSVVVLSFGLREDIATRTSIVVMALASLIGFAYLSSRHGMAPRAWRLWQIAVPVVIAGAPFGAWLMRRASPSFIRRLLYTIIGCQFLTALVVIPLTPKHLILCFMAVGCSILFSEILSRYRTHSKNAVP